MTSVPPYGIRVPILLSGSRAHALVAALNAWGTGHESGERVHRHCQRHQDVPQRDDQGT